MKYEFYTCEGLESFRDLVERLEKLDGEGGWVYRGQNSKWELETTLERYFNLYRYPLTDAPGIEEEMIRNFRRLYSGEDRKDVEDDELYCISLMRHYGAPTRLLDFTYSKDVALYFGIEYAFDNVPVKEDGTPDYDENRSLAIWCINRVYTDSRIEKEYPELYQMYLSRTVDDAQRKDFTFRPLYMNNIRDFVHSENPVKLHQRLDIQHGVFLCPGNVTKSFMQNLSNLIKDNSKVIKFTCELNPTKLSELLDEFRKRTITRQSLLPGLDGFAQSMKYKLLLFKTIKKNREKDRKKLMKLQKGNLQKIKMDKGE